MAGLAEITFEIPDDGGTVDRQEIPDRLRAFPYDRDEYWVITGSAMVMYGIIP